MIDYTVQMIFDSDEDFEKYQVTLKLSDVEEYTRRFKQLTEEEGTEHAVTVLANEGLGTFCPVLPPKQLL